MAKVAISMAFSGGYGFHRDELYYLASARHLQWGYVDYPPLTPLLARVDQALFPGSLPGLRLGPALAGAGVVILAGLIARELGGRRQAQVLAGLIVLISPLYLGANGLFETVSFDQVTWAAACLLLARILRGGDRRLWLLLGLVGGVGMETKYTFAGLALAMLAGVLLTSRRRLLLSPWPWLGAAVALLLLLPNLAWQAGHGWDSLAYTLHHRGQTEGPGAYWLQQLVLVDPLLLPVATMGGVWLWRRPALRPLAWTLVLVELLFFVAGGKSYYPAPAYALAYAAGAVWLDGVLTAAWSRRAAVAGAVALSLILLPLALPVLPPAAMARSGLWKPRKDFADMYGWPDLTRQVAAAYDALPAAERSGAMVLAENYGEAGAIDLYGPAYGLPGAVSPHLTYYYWAPSGMAPETVVAVGYSRARLSPLFADIEEAGKVSNAYGLRNQEFGAPIYVCRQPRVPLGTAWPRLKTLD